jgi:hypothetical protein
MWTLSAYAQTVDVPSAPHAVIDGKTVAVWAEETSLGVCIVVAVKRGDSWILPKGPIGCKAGTDIERWPGGPEAYIDTLKEDISRQLASLYPPRAEKPVVSKINSALGKYFKLDTSKGTVALVRR